MAYGVCNSNVEFAAEFAVDKARIETPVLYTYKRQTAVEVRGEIRFRATARRGASRARDRRSRGCGKWACAEGRRKQRTCGSVVSGETRKCVVFKHKEAFCV